MKIKLLALVLVIVVIGVVGCDLIEGFLSPTEEAIVNIVSGGKSYPAFLVAPTDGAFEIF
jgi:hypothetical protein